jgi:RNA polymerase sigma-70 factor (ECF subfamily)
VGRLIALAGLDAETGVVMLLYLDQAWEKFRAAGRMNSMDDLRRRQGRRGAAHPPEDHDRLRHPLRPAADHVVARHAKRRGCDEAHRRADDRRRRHFGHLGQNEEDAADLAQDTFVRVFQNRTKFDKRMKFSTWLYAIATNLVRDRYRHRTRHPQVSLDAENEASGEDFRESVPEQKPTPSESLQNAERAESVRKAVGQLPEELRTPLILSEYEELSHAEIGEILDCTSKAVEVRLYRARNQLRNTLGWLMERAS